MPIKNIMLNPHQKRITCCYKCEDRTVGCHCSCEKYRNERSEMDKYYEKIKSERELNCVDAARATNKINWFRNAKCRK